MNVDVLILYEHINRELENACLLLAELKHRGYSVSIQNICSINKHFIKPKVIIVPHLYNDQQLINFCKNIWCSNVAILDLQYEQVLSAYEKDGIHTPRGQAKFAQHIAWGQAQVEEYLNGNISPKNIHVTGHIQMDLKNPIFDEYHIPRVEIAKEFRLDASKKWIMFLSSFSYTGWSEKKIKQFEKTLNPFAGRLAKLSDPSRKQIIEWFENVVTEYPEFEFIYRPHPAERNIAKILEIEKKYNNFKCINKYSVDQWVDSADYFYNWYSSSVADVFYKNKVCLTLRPISIPSDLEVDILKNSKMITSFDDFKKSLEQLKGSIKIEFPVKKEQIQWYYANDEKFSFQKIADICEKMINNTEMHYIYNYGKKGLNFRNSKSLKSLLGSYFDYFLFFITSIVKLEFLNNYDLKNIWVNRIKQYNCEAYGANKLIKKLTERFRSILDKLYATR